MLAYFNGAEVFIPMFNGTVADYILIQSETTDNETTAILGTAVLGKMVLGEGG